jgi:WD40 repeat protein
MPQTHLSSLAFGIVALGATLGAVATGNEQAPAGPRVDHFGDPLPEAAIARLGTVRFRHGANIAALSFTPDGKAVISRSFTAIRIWEADTGKELSSLSASGDAIFRASAVSADGTQIAVARRPQGGRPELPIQLWNLSTGRIIREFSNGIYTLLCFSPDGKQLAVTALRGVELFDVAQGLRLAELDTEQRPVTWLSFSPDGKTLITAGADHSVRFWDLANRAKTRELRIVNGMNSLALSPDGRLLAAIEFEEPPMGAAAGPKALNHIHIFDTATGLDVKQLVMTDVKTSFGDPNSFRSLAFSPDSKRLAAGAYDEFIRVYDIESCAELVRMKRGRILAGRQDPGRRGGASFRSLVRCRHREAAQGAWRASLSRE